jgi:hypothetical protein
MHVKRRLAVAMAGAVAVVGGVASVTLSAASAQAATIPTTVPLPITGAYQMLVDPVHQHLFIASGANSVLVMNYSGQTVATIANEPGATGLALSSDGSTVYAALAGGDAISAISTSTLIENTRYATGTGTDPTYVAYTSGKIWFGYGGAIAGTGAIGSIDPSTSPATVTLDVTNASVNTWIAAPMLTASPNGDLVVGEPNQNPIQIASYDVSSGTPAVLAAPRIIPNSDFLSSMQITPDGKDVVIAGSSNSSHQIFQVSDLSLAGAYPTVTNPDAVSIAINGTVAAGTNQNIADPCACSSSSEVFLFAPGGSTPLYTHVFQSEILSDVAIAPDGSELFAITRSSPFGTNPTLNIIGDPAQRPSTLSVTGPATDNKDRAITLTGTLGGTSPYAGGQTLQVTRIDPTNPNGVALLDVTTAADGSFTITDTPPKANVDSGTVTYKVSYAGDAYLIASAASVSVTVHYNNS